MATKIYGYVRISTKQQSIDRQIRNIKASYPKAVIIEEVYTGTTLDRPKWQALTKKLKQGDTVVFDSVSRMSRNAQDGYSVYESLYNLGVDLVFLKEQHISTATYKQAMNQAIPLQGTSIDFILDGVNKYLLSLAQEQIKIAFEQSQKEVDDLRQRTREGIETAKLEGKQIGQQAGRKLTVRKEPFVKELIKQYSKDFNGTLDDDKTRAVIITSIEQYNAKESDPKKHYSPTISRGTYYKYKKSIDI